MSRAVLAGSADQYVSVKLWSASSGVIKTDANHSTSGLSIKYQVNNGAVQSVSVGGSPAPASMSAGGSHADWGIYHRGNGWYVIGLADAVVSSAGDFVSVWLELADHDSMPVEVLVVGYDPSLVAVGAALASNFTATRAGYIDKLNVTGELAHSDDANTYRADVVSLASQSSVDAVDSVVDAIKLKTDALPPDPADASNIASSFGLVTSALNTIVGFIDTEVSAIKAKTDNLPVDPATETTLAAIDVLIDAIKAITDQITFTGGLVDANATATVDAAGIRTAIGLAAANLDTQLSALDTAIGAVPNAAANATAVRTELSTELGRIDSSISGVSTGGTSAEAIATEIVSRVKSRGSVEAN